MKENFVRETRFVSKTILIREGIKRRKSFSTLSISIYLAMGGVGDDGKRSRTPTRNLSFVLGLPGNVA